jgi:hypothetical protein
VRGDQVARGLSFSFRDIPACARYGFSARKIWVWFKTLVFAWLIWDIFVYLGFFAAGCDMAAKWDQSRLLPLPGSLFWMDMVPVIILIAGILAILYVLMRGSLMVSKITFQQIRGDEFFSSRDASRFAGSHSMPLIAVPVMLLVVMGLIFASGFVTGLLSRIPLAGPVIAALLSVPLWGLMLLGLLTLIGLIAAIDIVPAIVATTGGDTFESVFEVFSTITSQSWRLILYVLTAMVTLAVAGVAFLLATSLALGALSAAVSAGAGQAGLVTSMASGPQTLAPEILPFFSGLITFGQAGSGQVWTGIPGLLASVSGTAVFLVVISYLLSGWSAACTLIYIVLKFRKDGEDLPERADMEDRREFDLMYRETGTDTDR